MIIRGVGTRRYGTRLYIWVDSNREMNKRMKEPSPLTIVSGGVLLAVQAGSSVLVTQFSQAVTLTGPTQWEAVVPRQATITASPAHLHTTRTLTSDLVTQLRHCTARVTLTGWRRGGGVERERIYFLVQEKVWSQSKHNKDLTAPFQTHTYIYTVYIMVCNHRM